MDYSKFPDKGLVAHYIFHYPSEDAEEQEKLSQELNRRGLLSTAEKIFSEIYDYFSEIWAQKGKE